MFLFPLVWYLPVSWVFEVVLFNWSLKEPALAISMFGDAPNRSFNIFAIVLILRLGCPSFSWTEGSKTPVDKKASWYKNKKKMWYDC